jgi:hypothetical protein
MLQTIRNASSVDIEKSLRRPVESERRITHPLTLLPRSKSVMITLKQILSGTMKKTAPITVSATVVFSIVRLAFLKKTTGQRIGMFC